MDVETCWKWFDTVFLPSVKARTGRNVLLVLDNAPGHFPEFERDGVRVVFFPPNCTAWKQPCDLGIIAALKKRYKYMYLKSVLSYYDLPEDLKQLKLLAAGNLRRGAAGVEFGNPAHLLDAANFVKVCWDAITQETIKNCFKKAEIISLEDRPVVGPMEEEMETDEGIIELVDQVAGITLTQEELENFITCDDEDSPLIYDEILDDVNNTALLGNGDNNDDEETDTESEEEEASNTFVSFRLYYESFLQIKEQLTVEHFSAIGAANEYDAIASQFGKLERDLRELTRKEHNAKTNASRRQMTLHDFF
jgi:DDE superfamily endonuclease